MSITLTALAVPSYYQSVNKNTEMYEGVVIARRSKPDGGCEVTCRDDSGKPTRFVGDDVESLRLGDRIVAVTHRFSAHPRGTRVIDEYEVIDPDDSIVTPHDPAARPKELEW